MKIEKRISETSKVIGQVGIRENSYGKEERFVDVDVVHNEKGSLGAHIRPIPTQAVGIPTGYTHLVGMLILTPDQVDIIKSVKEELEKHPDIINQNDAHKAEAKKKRAELAELKRRGWCWKCESYCHGDCTAH